MTDNPKRMPARLAASASVLAPPESCGLILHESGRRHHWEGAGLLSIKTFSNGRALYKSGPGVFGVDDSSYLILNDGQPYSITIDSARPVESFCIFFRPGFAEQVYHGLSAGQRGLLDNPEPPGGLRIEFFDKTYPHDDVISPVLSSLKSSTAELKGRAGWLEEQLHELMRRLLLVRQNTLGEASALSAVRASTREELYRRLHRAKDYISACFEQPLTLGDIASAACLSPNHLLRSFHQAFRLTPHQFLTFKRMEHARRMLAEPGLPITEICFSVGYESPGSFSRSFRRHTGLSPSEYRRKR